MKALDEHTLKDLLVRLSKGKITVEESLERLKALPFEDLGFACVDHHRSLRRGLSEVIFGEGKEVSEILAIMGKIVDQAENVLVTRLSAEKAKEVLKGFPDSTYNPRARVLTLVRHTVKDPEEGPF